MTDDERGFVDKIEAENFASVFPSGTKASLCSIIRAQDKRIAELENAPLNLPGVVEAKKAIAERDALREREEICTCVNCGYVNTSWTAKQELTKP